MDLDYDLFFTNSDHLKKLTQLKPFIRRTNHILRNLVWYLLYFLLARLSREVEIGPWERGCARDKKVDNHTWENPLFVKNKPIIALLKR